MKLRAIYHEVSIDKLYTLLPIYKKKIKTYFELGNYDNTKFPGAYFSILAIHDILNFYNDNQQNRAILIFPIDLIIKQKNWHYNLIEKNGSFTYDTYFYHNIDVAPPPFKMHNFIPNKKFRDELVFHDGIPMEFLRYIILLNPNDIKYTISPGDPFTILSLDDFNNNVLGPIKCNEIQSRYLDKKSQPVILSHSNAYYKTTEDTCFFNNRHITKMIYDDFQDIILAALPKEQRNKLVVYLQENILTENAIDKWLIENDTINKCLKDKHLRIKLKRINFFKKLNSKKNKHLLIKKKTESDIINEFVNKTLIFDPLEFKNRL